MREEVPCNVVTHAFLKSNCIGWYHFSGKVKGNYIKMPKKGKGKGNKLARMSEEERARYMQHRAELELETKRRKQQLIAVFTKVSK